MADRNLTEETLSVMDCYAEQALRALENPFHIIGSALAGRKLIELVAWNSYTIISGNEPDQMTDSEKSSIEGLVDNPEIDKKYIRHNREKAEDDTDKEFIKVLQQLKKLAKAPNCKFRLSWHLHYQGYSKTHVQDWSDAVQKKYDEKQLFEDYKLYLTAINQLSNLLAQLFSKTKWIDVDITSCQNISRLMTTSINDEQIQDKIYGFTKQLQSRMGKYKNETAENIPPNDRWLISYFCESLNELKGENNLDYLKSSTAAINRKIAEMYCYYFLMRNHRRKNLNNKMELKQYLDEIGAVKNEYSNDIKTSDILKIVSNVQVVQSFGNEVEHYRERDAVKEVLASTHDTKHSSDIYMINNANNAGASMLEYICGKPLRYNAREWAESISDKARYEAEINKLMTELERQEQETENERNRRIEQEKLTETERNKGKEEKNKRIRLERVLKWGIPSAIVMLIIVAASIMLSGKNYIKNRIKVENTYVSDKNVNEIASGSLLQFRPSYGEGVDIEEVTYRITFDDENDIIIPDEPIADNHFDVALPEKEPGHYAEVYVEVKGSRQIGGDFIHGSTFNFVYTDKEATLKYFNGTTAYKFPSRALLDDNDANKNIILPNEQIKIQASAPEGEVVAILYRFNDEIVHEIEGADGFIMVPDADPYSSDVLRISSKVEVAGELFTTEWIDYKVQYGDDSLNRTVKISYDGNMLVAFAGPTSDKANSTVAQFAENTKIHIEADKTSDVQDIYFAWDQEDVMVVYGVNIYDLEIPAKFANDQNRHYFYVKTKGIDGFLSTEWQCYCFEYEVFPTTMKVYYNDVEVDEQTIVNARPGDVLHVDAFSEAGVSYIGWNIHDMDNNRLTNVVDINSSSIDIALPDDIHETDFTVWIEAIGNNATSNPFLPYQTGWKKYHIHYTPISAEIVYNEQIISPGETIMAKPGETINVKAFSDAGVAYIGWYIVVNNEKITETTDVHSDEIAITLPEITDGSELIVFIEAVNNEGVNGYKPEYATGWLGVRVHYND